MPKKIDIHLKVDTGMGRLGIRPDEAGLDFIRWIQTLPGLRIAGMFTHLASADSPDKTFAQEQLAAFIGFSDAVIAGGIEIPLRHAANSAALLDMPEAHLDMVRPGISLYGLYPSAAVSRQLKLRPVMSLAGNISFVKHASAGTVVSYGSAYTSARDEYLATLPAGYADGISRGNYPRGEVLIGGRRCPIAGRICMDQLVVSCGDDPVQAGQPFIILGEQGEEEITADELAARIDTINYEIVCMAGGRVPRRYLSGKQLIAEEYLNWVKA